MQDKKTLIYKEDLLDSVLGHFGCNLAYLGRDLQYCQEAIAMAPAVDASEEVHGRWLNIEYDSMWGSMIATCSHCAVRGEVRVKSISCGVMEPDSPHCPHCGAKMDGESI